MKSLGYWLATIALLLLAVVGLAMSLCGGVFTVTVFGSNGTQGALAISLPSLLIGLAVLWRASGKLRQRFGAKAED